MAVKFRLLAASLGLAASSYMALSALDSKSVWKELLNEGLTSSSTYQKALDASQTAKEQVQGFLLFNKTSVNMNGAYNFNYPFQSSNAQNAQGAASTASVSTNLTIPVIQQLTLSASLNQDLSGQVKVQINPLSHDNTSTSTNLALEKALIQEEKARLDTETALRKTLVSYLQAREAVKVAVLRQAYKEASYTDEKKRYDLGKSSTQALRSSLKAWSESQNSEIKAEQTLLQAYTNLRSYLSSASIEELEKFSLAELIPSLSTIDELVLRIQNSRPKNPSGVDLAAIDLALAKSNLGKTWIFEPNLALSGALQYNNTGLTVSNLGASFSLSLDSFKDTERTAAEKTLSQALDSYARAVENANSERLLAHKALDIAKRNLEISQLSQKDASESLSETQVLFQAGKAAQSELDDADLALSDSLNQELAIRYAYWEATLSLASWYIID